MSYKIGQKLASKLPYVDKVLFVVDRKDLDYQTMKEYDRFERGAANGNRNTKILQRQLENKDNKGNPHEYKIIVTTIQKLDRFIVKNPDHPGLAIKTVFEWTLGLCDSCKDLIEQCYKLQSDWLLNDKGNFVIDKEYIDSFSDVFSHYNLFGFGKKEKYRIYNTKYKLYDGGTYSDKNFIEIEPILIQDIENYLEAMTEGIKATLLEGLNPLLVLPMFFLDFLKIEPFGNCDEEVIYLTMLRVLFNGDFESIKYISLVRFLEQNRLKLLESIGKSLEGWNEGNNDYKPVVLAFLEIVDEMYQQSIEQIVPLYTQKMNKQERIDHAISTYGTIFTKVEISILCPDASSSSIENVLANYNSWKINGGRAAAYDPLGFNAGVRRYYLRYD